MNNCPACKATDINIVRPYRNVHDTYSRMNLARCNSCSLVFSTPMPSQAELDIYNASYFESANGGYNKSTVALAFFKGIAKIRAAYLSRFLVKNNIEARRILEIGPGHGFFAENWISKHSEISYYAIETDTSCHKSLLQLGVELVTSTGNLPEVDVVIISHVLEHVSSPYEFLSAVTKSLRLGGVLFIEVPCQDWKHKSIDEPHLLFFEKQSMDVLLKSLDFFKIQLSYHGKEISSLQNESAIVKTYSRLRNKLMNMGIIAPFAQLETGLKEVTDPLERAAIKPFKPHVESQNPSWWLRAVAIKN
jgi:hypothetical protein